VRRLQVTLSRDAATARFTDRGREYASCPTDPAYRQADKWLARWVRVMMSMGYAVAQERAPAAAARANNDGATVFARHTHPAWAVANVERGWDA
jgi:hypothetical protein